MTLIIIGGSRLLFPPQQDLSVGLFRDQKVQTNLQGNSDFQLLVNVRECCILLFDCQLLSDWSFTHAGSTDCSVLLPHFKVSDGSRCIFPPVRFERVVQLCKDSLAVKTKLSPTQLLPTWEMEENHLPGSQLFVVSFVWFPSLCSAQLSSRQYLCTWKSTSLFLCIKHPESLMPQMLSHLGQSLQLCFNQVNEFSSQTDKSKKDLKSKQKCYTHKLRLLKLVTSNLG